MRTPMGKIVSEDYRRGDVFIYSHWKKKCWNMTVEVDIKLVGHQNNINTFGIIFSNRQESFALHHFPR